VKASINGITIGYDDVGSSENALVLVHGHPFDRSMWRPQDDHISRQDAGSGRISGKAAESAKISRKDAKTQRRQEIGCWRVIAPDLRGYGESSVVPGKTTLDVFVRDIAGLLDYLDIEEVVIGGLSMGGQIVMEFCRLCPERVRGILLAATFPKQRQKRAKATVR
jgi:pimeloyl-ACP methyl ester carboxylesterase